MTDVTSDQDRPDPIRVFLVDDHPVVRRGLAALLETEPDLEVAGEADGIVNTAEQLAYARPHVLLIDLDLGHESGLDLMRYIRNQWVGIRTIVVSHHPCELFAARAVAAGASGYVCKEQATDQIVKAIRTVLDGGHFFGSPG